MDFVWDGLLDILFGWIFDLLYRLQSGICTVIDFIVDTFYKLSGLESVSVDGKQTDLLSHFIETPAIRTAFFGIFLIGVILLCIFVLIAIIRSEYADQQHKRTKAQILVKAGQSFLIFLIIPLLLAAGILLTNTVMSAVNGSMLMGVSSTGHASFGGQILTTSGYNAYIGPSGARAEIERKFISGELDYTNLSVVKQYYDLWHVNFIVGIFSGLVLVILFALAALRFVQRLFDVILLYVISPVSVATIPVDDGARFKLWREMLISKVLSAYGIIFAMNLFFLITPQVSRIQFYNNGFQNGLIGLLFIIGGAFAVTKAYMVIAQLTGSNAGAQEAQQTMAGIYSGIRMARGATRFAAGAVGQVIGGSDFRTNQRKGMGFGDNLNSSIHGNRNQRVVGDDSGRKKDKDDKEKKDGGVPPNGGGGNNGGGTQQRTQTEKSNQNTSSNTDSRQYRGADNNAQTHTDGGQTAFTNSDSRESNNAEKESVQTHTDNGQGALPADGGRQPHDGNNNNAQSDTGNIPVTPTDMDNRQRYGEQNGNAQGNTDSVQPLASDNDGRQSGTANPDNSQAPRTDTDNLQITPFGKDGVPATDSGAKATEGAEDSGKHGVKTVFQKTGQVIGGALRLSNMPIGMLKDLLQGGVITAGKNAWPRLRNVVTGRGIINHADVKPKLVKGGGKTTTVQTESAIKPQPVAAKPETVKPQTVKPDKKDNNSGGKK